MSSSQKKAGGKAGNPTPNVPKIKLLRKAQQSKPPTLNVPVAKPTNTILPQTGCVWQSLGTPLSLSSFNGLGVRFLYSFLKDFAGPRLLEEDLVYRMVFSITPSHAGTFCLTDDVTTEEGRAVAHGNPMQEFPQGAFRANEKFGFELVFTAPTHAGMQNQNFKHSYAVALCLDFDDVPEGSKNPSYRFNEVWIERKAFPRAGPLRSLITVGLFDDADDLDRQ
uniref:Coat protein n=3 Tax=Alfalfa mosaic virus TaxID=12321 RepID=A0A2H4TEV4_AMV|nr:coat protein [Alfalfa mosaic virus]AUD53823.1 coat protein [Alfalfa mosaic virus]